LLTIDAATNRQKEAVTNRIAIATFDQLPRLSPDDQLLLHELKRIGVSVEPVIWSDQVVDWTRFTSVVIRSCWDYHHHHESFLKWLSRLENLGITVLNRPSLIRWNLDKIYLKEIEAKGFPIAPTIWLDRSSPTDLPSLLRMRDWRRLVIKPRISASGFHTMRIGPEINPEDSARFDHTMRASGGMVQQYLEAIETEGEWSLIFFNKEYSHAVLKRPQSGEFRVQAEHGGATIVASPPSAYIEVAQEVVNSIDGTLLFARVDGVPVAGRFTLMELELIEPYLFLDTAKSAAKNFADAILSAVGG
jgi:glutathione synthase/RimK-type ligase-like ATP-grasp enzyme